MVTKEQWQEKAENFQAHIKEKPYPPNIDWYRNIIERVHIGQSIVDVGSGDCYIKQLLPDIECICLDPYPRNNYTFPLTAEELIEFTAGRFDTVFALASLDNVRDLHEALIGIRHAARQNVVIVTGIGIEPDKLHTIMVTREELVSVLGEPAQEVELSPKCFLFEFNIPH